MALRTPVYLDHHATTPLDPRVLELLQKVQREHFGNPSSAGHAFGWAAARIVEEAREKVAALIGATAREIIFTSGATEANNLALSGVGAVYGQGAGHIVTTSLEHEAVSRPLEAFTATGGRVTVVGAGPEGLVDPADVAAALEKDTIAVSVIAAQNEIGTIQPVEEIAAICRGRGILLHTDAAQAAGKIPLDVGGPGADLVSLSAHKMYGPKGVGALFARRRDPRVTLVPQMRGGGQERGLRSGTLNVPGIAAFGEACLLAAAEMEAEGHRLRSLRDRLWSRLSGELTGVRLNGSAKQRLPGNLNVSFAGVKARSLTSALTVLAVSTGSACSSADAGPSRVLESIGVPAELAAASLRIGLGRFTTQEEVDFAAEKIMAAVRRLRDQDPE
jgi:cysteine desulfurase